MVTRAVDGRQMKVRTRWLMIGKRLPSRARHIVRAQSQNDKVIPMIHRERGGLWPHGKWVPFCVPIDPPAVRNAFKKTE
jgi:hypothetical protein